MHDPDPAFRPTDAFRSASNSSRATRHPDTALQALFAEVGAMAKQLRKPPASGHGETGCSSAGSVVLQALDGLGPQTVPAIARARALSRQNIQILVNRLESQGLVALAPNPAHKRSPLVQLTASGRNLLASLKKRQAHSLQELLLHVSAAHLVSATRLLQRLRSLLTGNRLPPSETGGEDLVPPHSQASRRPTRRRKALPANAAPASSIPEPVEPADDEFPINLL